MTTIQDKDKAVYDNNDDDDDDDDDAVDGSEASERRLMVAP